MQSSGQKSPQRQKFEKKTTVCSESSAKQCCMMDGDNGLNKYNNDDCDQVNIITTTKHSDNAAHGRYIKDMKDHQ